MPNRDKLRSPHKIDRSRFGVGSFILTAPRNLSAWDSSLSASKMTATKQGKETTVDQGVFVVPDVSIKELLDAIP